MNDEHKKALDAIKGVLAVADSNWPSGGDIMISTNGSNTASVKLPSYVFAALLRDRIDK